MDLNALVVFAKVVEAKSFSEAARRLGMPVSTVSRRVAELEDQLGVRLLDRSTRNLRLTDLGSEVLEHAQRSAEASEAVQNIVSNRQSSEPSLKKVRAALLQLGETISDTKRMFGANKNQVDPVRHLVGTALVWGGLPEKDALYLPVTPARNDGTTVHKLTVKNVPVDGFWSITVYNADGYLEPNQYNAYSVNKVTAKKGADGSVAIQFGGCDGEVPNCLPIMKGWNYTVRLFRPRPEILHGTWRFPEAQSVS